MLNIIKLQVGELKANCYIVYKKDTSEAIIIDPGSDYDKIEGALIENGLYLKAILLTHGHFDHIGAVSQLAIHNIPIYIHQLDADKLYTDNNLAKQFGYDVPNCSANMLFGGKRFDFSIAGIDISAFHTPGHSKGSSCYLIEDYLFSGDTLFKHGYGRTDLYDGNFDELKNSLRFLKTIISKNTKIMPGHD